MLKYEKDLVLAQDDLDEKGYVAASRLFRFFEDVSIDHVESMGMGFDDLIKKNYIWVLSKLKYEAYARMDSDKNYIIATYPRPKKAVTFGRDYCIYDSAGNIVLAGTSQWCILNFKTRKIERTGITFDGEFFKGLPLDGRFEKIHDNDMKLIKTHVVTESDLDNNNHVNNCRYVDFVCEITGQKAFSDFNIYFAKETVAGDQILLYEEQTEDGFIVMGKLRDDTAVFQAKGRKD